MDDIKMNRAWESIRYDMSTSVRRTLVRYNVRQREPRSVKGTVRMETF
jgi:hypothetical protein